MSIFHHTRKTRIILQLLILALPIYCQTENQLVPVDLKQQTIVTEPVTLRKGFLRAGILLNYRVADKYFNDSGNKEYYVGSTWSSKSAYNLTLQYGLTDRFQIDISAEYLNIQKQSKSTELVAATNTTRIVVSEQKGLGLGDTHLAFNYQLLPETGYKISLTGGMKITLPTGKKNPTNIISVNQYDLPVGDGAYALAANLFARSIVYPYSFTGHLGYSYNFSGTKIINPGDNSESKFRSGNMTEAGLSANIHLNEWIVLANELNFYHKGAGKIDNVDTPRIPASWAFSYQPNLVFQVKRFRLGESVKIPIKGKNVPADPLLVIMIQYLF
jgi:hypothetical protein